MKNILEMFSVKGQVVVVTGAGSGIGAEVANQLCFLGANVVLVDIDKNKLKEQQENLSALDGGSVAIECNVAEESQVIALRDEIIRCFGKIDVLINSHGISRRASATDITTDQFDAVVNINLRGVFLTTSVFGRVMVEQGGGNIVNISSIAAHVCLPNNVNYAAAKGGVEAMTRAFAGEWASRGVRVNAIAPGPCRTAFTESLYAQPGYEEKLIKKIPRNKIGTPIELMGAILLMVSEAGKNIYGQTIIVDGGYTIV